jgi:two-component system chemotaxis response regulator CheB
MTTKKIRVMVVDDSAVVRQTLTTLFRADQALEVIGAAADPILAMTRMAVNWPDVLVLDVEMPRMDGISFLKKLMVERPTPVVICSTLTSQGASTTMEALAAGAVGIVEKPKLNLQESLEASGGELITAVKAAAQANMSHHRAVTLAAQSRAPSSRGPKTTAVSPLTTTNKVIAMGTSTGGTQALEVVLRELAAPVHGIVIVQHMPEKFTAAFSQRLNSICELEVLEAKSGDRVLPGRALIAPGGRHMTLSRQGAQYLVDVFDGPPVSRHRPSVDVLFRSVAKFAGTNALGIIMTGMGDDGARGLKEMRDSGSQTLGQDEASCVVYGMPQAARKLGAVGREVALQAVASEIMKFCEE